MKCYLHASEEIVAQCPQCSRGLCAECSDAFQKPICRGCADEQNREYRKGLARQLLLSGGIFLFVLMSLLGDAKGHQTIMFKFMVAYAAASIPWGWSMLNRLTPNVFLILPLIGWLFYFGVKFYFAGMIGMFVAPFKNYRAIQELRELNRQSVLISN